MEDEGRGRLGDGPGWGSGMAGAGGVSWATLGRGGGGQRGPDGRGSWTDF